MHLYTSDDHHAWYHLNETWRPARSVSKATKYKIKNSCPQWDLNSQSWDLKSDALPTGLHVVWWKLGYLNGLYKYMYFRYQCIHWYNFEGDEEQRMLSCTCTVLYWSQIRPFRLFVLSRYTSRQNEENCIIANNSIYVLIKFNSNFWIYSTLFNTL